MKTRFIPKSKMTQKSKLYQRWKSPHFKNKFNKQHKIPDSTISTHETKVNNTVF